MDSTTPSSICCTYIIYTYRTYYFKKCNVIFLAFLYFPFSIFKFPLRIAWKCWSAPRTLVLLTLFAIAIAVAVVFLPRQAHPVCVLAPPAPLVLALPSVHTPHRSPFELSCLAEQSQSSHSAHSPLQTEQTLAEKWLVAACSTFRERHRLAGSTRSLPASPTTLASLIPHPSTLCRLVNHRANQ